MSTPQITIHNALTGETVTRDMNASELAQYKKDKLAYEADAEAAQINANKRQTILDRLGITTDELQTLLG